MSIFTRRNYIWLSSVCRDMRHEVSQTTDSLIALNAVDSAIGVLAEALWAENPGFDRARFLHNIQCPLDHSRDHSDSAPCQYLNS